MYPRLAKASLIGLCVVCVFALLTFVVGRALGDEHAQYVSRAFLLFVLLVFSDYRGGKLFLRSN